MRRELCGSVLIIPYECDPYLDQSLHTLESKHVYCYKDQIILVVKQPRNALFDLGSKHPLLLVAQPSLSFFSPNIVITSNLPRNPYYANLLYTQALSRSLIHILQFPKILLLNVLQKTRSLVFSNYSYQKRSGTRGKVKYQ